LHEHEQEVERLREEVESKATILPKVREWAAVMADEEELEKSMKDPNRFSARGGAMLREEKLRKRVAVLKPKVSSCDDGPCEQGGCWLDFEDTSRSFADTAQLENELLNLLPAWEAESGRPFMRRGQRVADMIHDAREAKVAAVEAKKVSTVVSASTIYLEGVIVSFIITAI
jgi:protein regulator of cytokinesis 1